MSTPTWTQPEIGSRWMPTDCVRALCQLTEEVMAAVGHSKASDCFCGFGGVNDGDGTIKLQSFRHDGATIRFIQAAVREKLATVKAQLDAQRDARAAAEAAFEQLLDEVYP
jgi:hypothetical protein